MTFEWDEEKNRANIRNHGIAFEDAQAVFDGPTLAWVDDRFDYGETRIATIGFLRGVQCVVVIHTERDTVTRIISARKALKHERRQFEATIF